MITVDFNRLNLRPGDRVLDVGCGSGRHTAEAARFPGVMSIGSDLCFEDLCKARERFEVHAAMGEHGGGLCDALVADITNLPYRDGFFDVVVCSEVLEHVPDHDRAISELLRVLKPGRNLVVSVPRRLPEKICWLLSEDYYNSNGGHIRIYHEKNLTRRIELKGAKQWARHHAHGLHSPYWWLKCLVGPTRTDSKLVDLYHRLLVWDMMEKPNLTRNLEKLLNPLIGKSVVLYLRKDPSE